MQNKGNTCLPLRQANTTIFYQNDILLIKFKKWLKVMITLKIEEKIMKEYKVECVQFSGWDEDTTRLGRDLNGFADGGWRLVSSSPIAKTDGVTRNILLFFERDK
jgi:hypothetical protein